MNCLIWLCCGIACAWATGQDANTKILGTVERLDPAFDALVPESSQIEILADGFEWSEGPVWIASRQELLFSDIPRNQIVRWDGKQKSVFLERSGFTGAEPFTGEEPGSNGLMLDSQKRLVMCQHGDRQVARLNADGSRTVLASRYQGKRFNSPNDLVFHSNGDLYFTDPPYGLPKRYEDPARELDWCGVYRLSKDGNVTLLTNEMTRPNGIAFSPDEKTLYVAQSDPEAAIWKAFPVKDDGTLGEGKIFYDATRWVGQKKGLPDGMVVDQAGYIWATGPGGVLVFHPSGKLLGVLNTGEATANCTFGEDGSTLFITADMYLCKIKTNAKGIGF
ncbi:MAG: SMP-30/gluconolactonase/LRE family protein [Pirellulaceae bacterium]